MGKSDIVGIIAGSRLFRSLSGDQQRAIADAASLLRVEAVADGYLYRTGDPSTHLYLIVETAGGVGPAIQVQLGDTVSAGFGLVEGELVGDVEFLKAGLAKRPDKRVSSARVLRDVLVLAISVDVVASVVSADADLRRRLVSQTTDRLIGITTSQAQRHFLDPQVRFAKGLLALLDDYGHVVGNKGVFDRRVSQDDLRRHFDQSLRWVSQRLSDWSPRGLVDTVPIGLPDFARVELIADLSPPDLATKFERALQMLESQIASALMVKAGQTAADLLSLFPENPIAAYYMALVSARCGAPEQAEIVLSTAGLGWSGSIAELKDKVRESWRLSFGMDADAEHGDEASKLDALLTRRLTALCIDIGALHARLRKNAMENAGSRVEADVIALQAADLYRQVSDASPNHYCAVNAATLSLLAGDAARARPLADQAYRLAARDRGYWAAASMAEAALVKGDSLAATSLFAQAAAEDDADPGKLASTRRQLQLIKRTSGLAVGQSLATLDPGHALCFSGHIMRPSDGSASELAAAEATLAQRFRTWLHGRRIASVHMSLACGADIIFAEQAQAADIPVHVALPFTAEAFCKASVEIGNGPGAHTDWVRRYYACLDAAANITELWRHEIRRGDLNPHFASANRHIMGETLKQADLLATQPMMLAAIADGARESRSFAAMTLDQFAARGVLVDTVAWPLPRRAQAAPAKEGFHPFAHVVFAFARSTEHNDAARKKFERHGLTLRTLKDRRVAGHFVSASVAEATAKAKAIVSESDPAQSAFRAICDYGPVRGRGNTVILDELLKLEAAADLKPLAIGTVFATSAFAMDAIARGAATSGYAPLGVGEGDAGLRGAREIYLMRDVGRSHVRET